MFIDDLVKNSYLFSFQGLEAHLYKGTIDCVVKTWKEEGIKAYESNLLVFFYISIFIPINSVIGSLSRKVPKSCSVLMKLGIWNHQWTLKLINGGPNNIRQQNCKINGQQAAIIWHLRVLIWELPHLMGFNCGLLDLSI